MFTNSSILNNNQDVINLQAKASNERDLLIKQITILKTIKSDWSEFNRQV